MVIRTFLNLGHWNRTAFQASCSILLRQTNESRHKMCVYKNATWIHWKCHRRVWSSFAQYQPECWIYTCHLTWDLCIFSKRISAEWDQSKTHTNHLSSYLHRITINQRCRTGKKDTARAFSVSYSFPSPSHLSTVSVCITQHRRLFFC